MMVLKIIACITCIISLAIVAAVLSILTAFILQVTGFAFTRLKLPYLLSYRLSFLSWLGMIIFFCVGYFLSICFGHLQAGITPVYYIIMILVALPVISILCGIRISHADDVCIGIVKGIAIAGTNTSIHILLFAAMLAYIASLGP